MHEADGFHLCDAADPEEPALRALPVLHSGTAVVWHGRHHPVCDRV